jgi:hypothetical protein
MEVPMRSSLEIRRRARSARPASVGAGRASALVRRVALTGLVALVLSGAGVELAQAHYDGQPNSSIAAATGPVGSGVSYSGQFGGSGDVDYYWFTTTRPGVSLHFNVRNLQSSCGGNSSCQIYATLIDPDGNQLGGEGSSAGTGPVGWAGSGYSTGTIDWTFGPAGRYLLVVDSDEGTPPYRFAIDASDGVAPGISGGALFRSFAVASARRPPSVRATMTVLADRATVRLELLRNAGGRAVSAGRLLSRPLARGRHVLRVRLNASARRALGKRCRLPLTVKARFTATGRTPRSATRRVTVRC